MIKRTLYIGSKLYISTKDNQLVLINSDGEIINKAPISDIGFIELDSPDITISMQAIRRLQESGVVIMTTDYYHNPAGLFIPFSDNNLTTKRIKSQIDFPKNKYASLWKEIVVQKIKNQSQLLKLLGLDYKQIEKKIERVKPADSTNQEGSAASLYWKYKYGKDFIRDRYGDYPNILLNYGYAIIRSIITRAIVSAGMHPSIGIFHKNQYNQFCLADDLIEPYRIFVDKFVYSYKDKYTEILILEKCHKKDLLELINIDIILENSTHPLQIAVEKTINSYVQVIACERKNLLLPNLCE